MFQWFWPIRVLANIVTNRNSHGIAAKLACILWKGASRE